MKRKVIQLAGKTLVISLPSKWVKEFEIKKGDELEVEKDGRKLIILTENNTNSSKGILNASDFSGFVKRRISTAYKKGIEELEVRYSEPSVLKHINDALKYLMGYEIVQQGKGYCIIKNIAKTIEEEFDVLLRRIFLLILDMHEEGINAIKEKNFEKLRDVSLAEETNDKLTNVCKRLINKRNESNNSNLLYCIVWELEKIADEYEELFVLLSEKKRISGESFEMLEKAGIFMRSFYDLFYDFSDKKGIEFERQRNEIELIGIKALEKTAEPRIIHSIMNIIYKTDSMAGPFYAMVL